MTSVQQRYSQWKTQFLYASKQNLVQNAEEIKTKIDELGRLVVREMDDLRREVALDEQNTNPKITPVQIENELPIFWSSSGGSYEDLVPVAMGAANRVIPLLRDLAWSTGRKQVKAVDVRTANRSKLEEEAASRLKHYFDQHGSDKANVHNYHLIYGPILHRQGKIDAIFEVGLGTNNPNLVSTMGSLGRPGASLRGFRDFATEAEIHGADVDRQILFQEDRIMTHFVDQTKPETFDALRPALPERLNLIIDDGLHSLDANLATLTFGLSIVQPNGWVVVEDIPYRAQALWELVGSILPARFEPTLFACAHAMAFAVNRTA